MGALNAPLRAGAFVDTIRDTISAYTHNRPNPTEGCRAVKLAVRLHKPGTGQKIQSVRRTHLITSHRLMLSNVLPVVLPTGQLHDYARNDQPQIISFQDHSQKDHSEHFSPMISTVE
jgi:hypothetical protein